MPSAPEPPKKNPKNPPNQPPPQNQPPTKPTPPHNHPDRYNPPPHPTKKPQRKKNNTKKNGHNKKTRKKLTKEDSKKEDTTGHPKNNTGPKKEREGTPPTPPPNQNLFKEGFEPRDRKRETGGFGIQTRPAIGKDFHRIKRAFNMVNGAPNQFFSKVLTKARQKKERGEKKKNPLPTMGGTISTERLSKPKRPRLARTRIQNFWTK